MAAPRFKWCGASFCTDRWLFDIVTSTDCLLHISSSAPLQIDFHLPHFCCHVFTVRHLTCIFLPCRCCFALITGVRLTYVGPWNPSNWCHAPVYSLQSIYLYSPFRVTDDHSDWLLNLFTLVESLTSVRSALGDGCGQCGAIWSN